MAAPPLAVVIVAAAAVTRRRRMPALQARLQSSLQQRQLRACPSPCRHTTATAEAGRVDRCRCLQAQTWLRPWRTCELRLHSCIAPLPMGLAAAAVVAQAAASGQLLPVGWALALTSMPATLP